MASAALSGTLTTYDPIREATLVAGGRTLILTLTGDTWVASGALFNAQRQAILDGLTSDQDEPAGWNATVRDAAVVTSVVRTSNTVVTITLAAAPTYDITADETITVTIPGSALNGAADIEADSTLSIMADVSGFESLPVATTVVALTPASYRYTPSTNTALAQEAQRAQLTCDTADLRWTIDPAVTVSDTDNGHTLKVGDTLELEGSAMIRNFRTISISGTTALLHATYFF